MEGMIIFMTVYRKHTKPFFEKPDIQFITVVSMGESIAIEAGIPEPNKIGKKGLVIIKVHRDINITEENAQRELAFIEIFKYPLECLSSIAQVINIVHRICAARNFNFRRATSLFLLTRKIRLDGANWLQKI